MQESFFKEIVIFSFYRLNNENTECSEKIVLHLLSSWINV